MLLYSCNACGNRASGYWTGSMYQPPGGWYFAVMNTPNGGEKHCCSESCREALVSAGELQYWPNVKWRRAQGRKRGSRRRLELIKQRASRGGATGAN
jgi:hypothetical protein